MKKRSNFTPMKRFHEILDNYGLKLMEVGTNHLRVFFQIQMPDLPLRASEPAVVGWE